MTQTGPRRTRKYISIGALITVSGALASFFTVIAVAPRSHAQAPDTVDPIIAAEMAAQHIPGLALSIMRDGQIIKARGYGLANVELNIPVTPESIFQTGSVGKQFTATAVMMLVEEGKVGLDDPVSKYFAVTPMSWRAIRVRHLLTHTSGIPDYETDSLKKGAAAFINLHRDYTEDELLWKLESIPLDFAPGEKFSYSNSGYMLLGILIHKAGGKFYGDLLQERIFRPLGMNATRIISEADIIPNRSAGYQLVKGELKNQDWVSPSLNTTADGAVYTTVLDMAKWDAALYTEKLVKRASLDEMWTPVRLNNGKTADYGFGWRVRSVKGHRLVEHGGAWQGFTTYIVRYLDDKLAIVILANLDGDHCDPTKIAHQVAASYIPDVAEKD
jgi:CubicO group peptidase (beta-lactamase class C family)